ncbi:hypothetical protein [Catenovulum agarivorans]|uniref:hypothetical protein n=1 Tax=Catenovulum agarivorans TaxID=1172192 RepID=UPI0002F07D33|nr:hypothetical protein [Catenovulum agarivorans]
MVDIKAALNARKVALKNAKLNSESLKQPEITKDSIRTSLRSAGILNAKGQVVTLVKNA